MTRITAAAMLLAATVAACGGTPPPQPAEGPSVVGRAAEPLFELELVADHSVYRAAQPIDVHAELTFRNAGDGIRVFHGAPPVSLGISQLDGRAQFHPLIADSCVSSDLRRGEPLTIAFLKSGLVDDRPPFDQAWFQDPVLRLPAGRWRFAATMSVTLDDCGRETHDLTTAVDLTVVP